jgi:hypothetical protein
MSVAALALLAACSNNAATNAANNAAPVNTAPANTAAAMPTAPSVPVTPTVSGKFIADGTPVKLTFVGAYGGDTEDGKPVIHIIFSTKTQSSETDNAWGDAYIGKLGDSIDLKMRPDGTILDVDYNSQSLKSAKTFSASGDAYKLINWVSSGGVLSGELTSNGPVSGIGDDKVDVDLTFKVGMQAPPPPAP